MDGRSCRHSIDNRHESAGYGMSVVPRHGDKEAGGRPTQHGVGVLLLQIRLYEMPCAASASVRDLTPPRGGYQLRLVGGVYRKK